MGFETFGPTFGAVIGTGSAALPFTPADIADLYAWWDPSDESTITEDVANAVTSIDDISGNGNTLSQATEADRPSTGLVTIGGLNAMAFDGSDSYLEAALTGLGADCTILQVVQVFSGHAFSCTLSFDATNDFQIQAQNNGQFWGEFSGAGLGSDANCMLDANSVALPLVLTHRAELNSGITCFENITQQAGTSPYTSAFDSSLTMRMAANRPNNQKSEMYSGETIIYDRALTPTELLNVQAYLCDKWKMALVIPSDIADLFGWWDPSNTSTITEQPNNSVASIDDLSGNGNDLAQSTNNAKPTTNANTMNSLNVMTFDGTSDFLEAALTGLSGDCTIFQVLNVSASSTLFASSISFDNVNDFQISAGAAGTFVAFILAAGLGGSGCDLDSDIFGLDATIAQRFELNVGMSCFLEGALQVGSPNYTSAFDSSQQMMVGVSRDGNNFLGVDFGEIVIYDRALTTLEMSQINSYLISKWGT